MTLLVDKRATTEPGLHVLVVGVSNYANLPDHDDPPAAATWGLTSIASPAISAGLVAEWLKSAANLALPLKTMRVLLSPTAAEQPLLPAWAAGSTNPTRDNFRVAVREWRQDCLDSPQSTSVFYFAGHGFTRGRGDNNLLLTMADLFDPADVKFARTVLASNIFFGMAPQVFGDTIARQQFFFFDCCRTFPDQMKNFDDRSVTPVLDVAVAEGVVDDRLYARYYAVPDNNAAFASTGRETYFTESLIDAFDRGGRSVGGGQWRLDGDAIAARLRARYGRLAERTVVTELPGRGPILCNLPGPPKVDVDIHLEPAADVVGRGIGLENAGAVTMARQVAVGQHKVEVLPGQYELQVRPPAGVWTGTNDRRMILPDYDNPWIAVGWP